MKKISSFGKVLTRDEAKRIVGGYDDGPDVTECVSRGGNCTLKRCCSAYICQSDTPTSSTKHCVDR